MKNTPFAFFGTSTFSVIVLDSLEKAGYIPSVVVTMPDRPKGRRLALTPSPVKVWANQKNIPVLQPEIMDLEFSSKLKALGSMLFIVASYGSLIPKKILDLAAHGALNIHPSLLPKLRGATPIQSAILEGLRETGVSIMLMDEKMDHGPIIASEKFKMQNRELDALTLETALAELGAKLLVQIVPRWLRGNIKPVPQDATQASYTRKFQKEDGLLKLDGNPEENFRKIRAFAGTIGTYFFVEKDRRKIRVSIKKARLENGTLIIERVLPESKKGMDYETFKKTIDNRQ